MQVNIAAVDRQAVLASLEIVDPVDRDYPGHIASHSRVAVPMGPAVVRAVVVLRLPLFLSMY
jgi:hypothetical protein